MKLVLVAGLNPRASKLGPKVHVYAGNWRLVVEKGVNCCFRLHNTDGHIDIKESEIFQSNGRVFWLEMIGGTEDYINVFAEYVKNGS